MSATVIGVSGILALFVLVALHVPLAFAMIGVGIVAFALQTALNMPLSERLQRHEQMLSAVREHDIHNWYGRFVHDLTGESMRRVRERADTRDPAASVARFPTPGRGVEYRQRK